MANQNANATITEQVRQHGEQLAALTIIVQQDHEDLHELKESTKIIAQAEARRSAREELKTKLLTYGLPVATALLGGALDHFIR